jgi:hypothetical protein
MNPSLAIRCDAVGYRAELSGEDLLCSELRSPGVLADLADGRRENPSPKRSRTGSGGRSATGSNAGVGADQAAWGRFGIRVYAEIGINTYPEATPASRPGEREVVAWGVPPLTFSGGVDRRTGIRRFSPSTKLPTRRAHLGMCSTSEVQVRKRLRSSLKKGAKNNGGDPLRPTSGWVGPHQVIVCTPEQAHGIRDAQVQGCIVTSSRKHFARFPHPPRSLIGFARSAHFQAPHLVMCNTSDVQVCASA